jgi:hypothetical protein
VVKQKNPMIRGYSLEIGIGIQDCRFLKLLDIFELDLTIELKLKISYRQRRMLVWYCQMEVW